MKNPTFKFWTFFLILVLFSINVSLLCIIKKSKTNPAYSYSTENYSMDINDIHNKEYFSNLIEIGYQCNSSIINNALVYFNNDTSNVFRITDIIDDKVLIFRFSGNYCDACNDFVIKKLFYHFSDIVDNTKILFIGSEINTRLIRDRIFNKSIMSFVDCDFGLQFEKQYAPFLFLLNKNGKVEMTFLPDKAMSIYTDLYLEKIKEVLFSDSK